MATFHGSAPSRPRPQPGGVGPPCPCPPAHLPPGQLCPLGPSRASLMDHVCLPSVLPLWLPVPGAPWRRSSLWTELTAPSRPQGDCSGTNGAASVLEGWVEQAEGQVSRGKRRRMPSSVQGGKGPLRWPGSLRCPARTLLPAGHVQASGMTTGADAGWTLLDETGEAS